MQLTKMLLQRQLVCLTALCLAALQLPLAALLLLLLLLLGRRVRWRYLPALTSSLQGPAARICRNSQTYKKAVDSLNLCLM